MLEVTLINKNVQVSRPAPDRRFHDSQKQPSRSHQSHSFVSTLSNNIHTRNHNFNNSKRPRVCMLCNGEHKLYTCISFLNLSVEDRLKFVDDHNLCRNCLRAGHLKKDCFFGPCKQCQERHNSLLHIENSDNSCDNNGTNTAGHAHYSLPADATLALHSQSNIVHNVNSGSSVNNSFLQPMQQALLCTALVDVLDVNNKRLTARVLLDNGSQHSFISESLFKRLNVAYIQSTTRISGVGQNHTQANEICKISIRSKTCDFSKRVKCIVLPSLTSNVPTKYVNKKSLYIPENYILADPAFYIPSQIDMILGADLFWDMLSGERTRLPSGPFLQSSKLGWLLSGSVFTDHSRNNKPTQCHVNHILESHCTRFRQTGKKSHSTRSFTLVNKRTINSNSFSVPRSANQVGGSFKLANSRYWALEQIT
jgi:hypothetical protein